MAMRTLLASSLVAVACAVHVVPARAEGDAPPLTVVLRAGTATQYAEVVSILKALREAHVSGIELESAAQQAAGVSAVIRAKRDTSYQAVVRALEALQSAGIRKAALSPQP